MNSWDLYFRGEEHAAVYNLSRPSPPQNLIKNFVDYVLKDLSSPLEEALDIGCGSGQSTEVLAPFFNKVTGFDPSEKQISEAQKKNQFSKISYKVGYAEQIDYPDCSVQLITACQACHWFDLPKFYAEVKRILVPGGVLAMYGYLLPRLVWKDKGDKLSNIIIEYFNSSLGKYIPPGSKMVYFENYRSDEFMKVPFAASPILRDDSVTSEKPGTIADVVAFINSGSAFQNYLKCEGPSKASALLQQFQKELLDTMGVSSLPEETQVVIQFKYFSIMAKKPVN